MSANNKILHFLYRRDRIERFASCADCRVAFEDERTLDPCKLLTPSHALAIYRKRWKIEKLFAALKTFHLMK